MALLEQLQEMSSIAKGCLSAQGRNVRSYTSDSDYHNTILSQYLRLRHESPVEYPALSEHLYVKLPCITSGLIKSHVHTVGYPSLQDSKVFSHLPLDVKYSVKISIAVRLS
jgi:hypothetical protein